MSELMLSQSAKQLSNLSVFVLIMVVFLIVITFLILFCVYFKFYSKCIVNGLEDQNIKKNIISDNKKYFQTIEAISKDYTKKTQEKLQSYQSLSDYIAQRRKRPSLKALKILCTTALGVLYVLLISIITMAIMVNIKGNLFYIGNTANLIIVTESMETAYEGNSYLQENNLTNQIPASSFITLTKIKDQNEINLYDIVAFKGDANKTIVHRVIKIYEEDGITKYICRGDSNNASKSFEIGLESDDFIGKFSGFQSYILGIILTYLRSGIGIITIMFAFITITLYETFDNKISKLMKKRQGFLISNLEKEIKQKISSDVPLDYISFAQSDNLRNREIKDIKQKENDLGLETKTKKIVKSTKPKKE